MAIDKVTLWNLALGVIGGAKNGLISSELSEQDAADYCRAFWEEAVDQSIIALRPDEATSYYNCAEVDSDDADYPEQPDWGYVFSLPSGYLDMVKYTNEDDRTANYEHKVIGEFILSDEPDCYIEYVHQIDYDDVAKMSPGLRKMIVAQLAVMVCPHYKPNMLVTAINNLAKEEAKSEELVYRHKYLPTTESILDID